MPMHDWTRVDAGIYHAFHHSWIEEIGRELNHSLPDCYYALAEQQAAGFGPDVLTLQDRRGAVDDAGGAGVVTRNRPKARVIVESSKEFYLRKKSRLVVRHVSGDRMVAVVEILSPGNKDSAHAFQSFVDKVCELLNQKIHLLLVDPFPPGNRDPGGLHASIFGRFQDQPFQLPAEQPLALIAYECEQVVRGDVEPIAVGDTLPDMPLFLEPHEYVDVPLERTYTTAWNAVPRRWREVVAPSSTGKDLNRP